jgi:exodeoxyribonuclease VII small subunit
MTAKKSPKSFEQSMEKLETIVSDMETGEFSLEKSLEKFEEGLALGKHCRAILTKAQIRVEKLVEDDLVSDEDKDGRDESK